jgi:translocation protein SEC62
MTERRIKNRNLEKRSMKMREPMTKIQKEVTDWMKQNIPTKKTKFLHSHLVNYFIGSKAIDMLMTDSPWAKGTENTEMVFDSRDACVIFLDTLLRYKMFHRAKKITVGPKQQKPDWKKRIEQKFEKEKNETKEDSDEKEEKTEEKEEKSEEKEEKTDNTDEDKQEEDKSEKDKKKRRIRLDMHLDQIFVDNNDAYVWLYDPIPWYYWLAGGAIVLVVIGLCLFPLWPKKIRRYAYYLSMLSVILLTGVIVAGIFKYILYWTLYLLSNFKLKFWILPNLTEDTSFIGSFWPLYAYTYTGEVRKEKDSDDEDEDCHEADKEQINDVDARKSGSSVGKDFEIIDNDEQIMSRSV